VLADLEQLIMDGILVPTKKKLVSCLFGHFVLAVSCLPALPLPLLKLGSNAFFKSKRATCTYGWCGAYLLYYYRKKQQLVGIQVGLFLFQPVRRTQVQGSNSSHHNDIFFSFHFRWLCLPSPFPQDVFYNGGGDDCMLQG
jgi:hypothetical protein